MHMDWFSNTSGRFVPRVPHNIKPIILVDTLAFSYTALSFDSVFLWVLRP